MLFSKTTVKLLGLCRSNRESELSWCFYFACLSGRSYQSAGEWSVTRAHNVKTYRQPRRCTSEQGSRNSLWVEHRTCDRKVASSNSGRNGGRIFFSRSDFLCRLLFGVRSTRVLRQWHVKHTDHSAKNVDSRLHLNTHTPWTQRSRSGLTMPLSRHSVGSHQKTSSHCAKQSPL